MDFVWLFKVRCHLCQEFVGGNADVYRIAKTPVDLLPDLLRCTYGRISGQQRAASHIGKSFIYAVLFHYRGYCPEIGDEFIGKYSI